MEDRRPVLGNGMMGRGIEIPILAEKWRQKDLVNVRWKSVAKKTENTEPTVLGKRGKFHLHYAAMTR